jgi:hypothetical protein
MIIFLNGKYYKSIKNEINRKGQKDHGHRVGQNVKIYKLTKNLIKLKNNSPFSQRKSSSDRGDITTEIQNTTTNLRNGPT